VDGYSIDLYRKDKSPKTSMVWRYFGRLTDRENKPIGEINCNYCILCLQKRKIFKYSKNSATTTLLLHLEMNHKITRDGDPAANESYYKRKKRETSICEKKIPRTQKSANTSSTICSICGKSFSAYHILAKHMRIHTGKNFACNRCPAKFAFRENLQRHEKIHEPNHLSRYICDSCGSSFAEIKSLKHHITRVHLNIPVEKNYSCNIEGCNMKFEKSFTLKKHMMTHTSLKPHECTFCDNAYASKGEFFFF
jgi:DNA-directed RNA polymerase subunit RPC12/RpoP